MGVELFRKVVLWIRIGVLFYCLYFFIGEFLEYFNKVFWFFFEIKFLFKDWVSCVILFFFRFVNLGLIFCFICIILKLRFLFLLVGVCICLLWMVCILMFFFKIILFLGCKGF